MIHVSRSLDKHLALFATDLEPYCESIYELAKIYSLPENKLKYFNPGEATELVYKNYKSSQLERVQTDRFDCFQFVWFVLKKACEYQILPQDFVYEQTVGMMKIVQMAIEQGILEEIGNNKRLGKIGIFFFLRSENGMTEKGQRHIGLYFVRPKGTVSFISNRHSKGGVVEDKFGSENEFFQHFSGMYKNYFTNLKS